MKKQWLTGNTIQDFRSILLIGTVSLLLTACGNDAPSAVKTAAAAEPTPASAAAAKTELSPKDALIVRGQKVYKKCRACHTIDEGGRNKVGPNLYGIVGARIATGEGFPYSKAFKASNVIWTDARLDAFLTKPKNFIAGNRMTFVGLKKEDDRKAVIAYLHANANAN